MANAKMCLEAARKACPDNQTHRSIYMIGFNEGYDRSAEHMIDKAITWLKANAFLYVDCYADECQMLRDFEKEMREE